MRQPLRRPVRRIVSPHRQALAKQRNRGLLLLAATVLIIGAIAALWFATAERRIKLADNLCPVDRPAPALAVVLLDQTDQLNPLQQTDLRNKLGALVKQLPVHARIQVFTFRNAAGQVSGPIVDLCNPGTAESWEAIYLNPELVRTRFKTAYLDRLDRAVDELVAFKDAPQSPILEAVQAVAVGVFGKPDFATVPDKRLYLASDLIQNTAQVNMFTAGAPDFFKFKQEPNYLRLRSNLSDVHVTLWQLKSERAIALQGESLIKFWMGYFNDLGARVEARLWVPS